MKLNRNLQSQMFRTKILLLKHPHLSIPFKLQVEICSQFQAHTKPQPLWR